MKPIPTNTVVHVYTRIWQYLHTVYNTTRVSSVRRAPSQSPRVSLSKQDYP